ncbi:MAG: molybdopterin synthase catalytic subunit MoaE [Pseudomonadota bacterium]
MANSNSLTHASSAPSVSSPALSIRVQSADFDLAAEFSALRAQLSRPAQTGALVNFVGLVRDMNEGEPVSQLSLEHYPGMSEKALQAIAAEASARWPIQAVRVVHRVGDLAPSEQIVFVGVSAAHRQEAFAACAFIVDQLKTRAPFWKRESTPKGSRWLDARETDLARTEAW